MRKFNKKSVIAAAALAILAVGGGTAFAYWTTTGSGTGAATTGTSTSWTVAAAPAQGPALTPGGAPQTVAVTVTNPGTGVQHLTSVSASVANADGSAWTAVADCSAADYTVSFTPPFTAADVAAGGTASGTATIQMVNSATNQDGCKLASVPLYFVAS
jgi:hypothetical protein